MYDDFIGSLASPAIVHWTFQNHKGNIIVRSVTWSFETILQINQIFLSFFPVTSASI